MIAQTRQSARDHALDEAAAVHREELARTQLRLEEETQRLMQANTALTEEIKKLTAEIHAVVARRA